MISRLANGAGKKARDVEKKLREKRKREEHEREMVERMKPTLHGRS